MSNNYQKFIRRHEHRKARAFYCKLCAILTPLVGGLCIVSAPPALTLFASLALLACALLGFRHLIALK